MQFAVVPDFVAPVNFFSTYYWAASWAMRIFGTSIQPILLPNLFALIMLMVSAYIFGRDIRSPRTGVAAALVMPALPAVFGMSLNCGGTMLQIAGVGWMSAFVWRWLTKQRLPDLAPAVFGGMIAVSSGHQLTYQALAIIHIAVALAVLSLVFLIRGKKEQTPARRLIAPLWGPAVVGVAALLTFGFISRWGDALAYQFGEMERMQSGDAGVWYMWPHYYLANIIRWYLSFHSLLILLAGFFAFLFLWWRKNAVMRWRTALLVWIILPTLLISFFNKPDPAYCLLVVFPLGMICAIAFDDIYSLGKAGRAVGVFLLFWFCVTMFHIGFSGRDLNTYHNIHKTLNLPVYPFLFKMEWNEDVEQMDRISHCLAEIADEVMPAGDFFFPSMLVSLHRSEQLRARISLARPQSFAFLPAEDIPYTSAGEPLLSRFDLFVVVLDEETAKAKTFREMTAIWRRRVTMERPAHRLDAMIHAEGEYRQIGCRCGMKLFKLE